MLLGILSPCNLVSSIEFDCVALSMSYVQKMTFLGGIWEPNNDFNYGLQITNF